MFWFFLVVYLANMFFFFFQAEDGIRDGHVTGVQTCALPISSNPIPAVAAHECETRHVALHAGDSFQHRPEITVRLSQLLELSHRGVIGLPRADRFVRSSIAL